VRSEYLYWFKTRKPARINLAASAVAGYSMAELGVRIEDIEIHERSECKPGRAQQSINAPGLFGYQSLQQAIAAKCGVPVECVVTASGTSMANYLAMAALIRPGDEVLIEQPAYEPLLALADYLGAEIKRFARPFSAGFMPVIDPTGVSSRTKLIVLTNLHNPSCVLISDAMLRHIGQLARSVGARVLVDEVYVECLYEKAYSAFHLGDEFVVTSSLTKAYGLGGLRCGWVLAQPELAQRMGQIKDLVDPSVPHPAQRLSVLAFERLDRIAKRAKTLLAANREVFNGFLSSCPHLDLVRTGYGTCVFPRLTNGKDIERFVAVLRDRYETDVVPGRFFEMPDHFRLGIGVETETLARGLERVNSALEQS
jgi:aspartate/methionine/tyrosine aminotransferase